MGKRHPVPEAPPAAPAPAPVAAPDKYKIHVQLETPTGRIGLELMEFEAPAGEADIHDWLGNEIDKALVKGGGEGFGYAIVEHLKRFAKPSW